MCEGYVTVLTRKITTSSLGHVFSQIVVSMVSGDPASFLTSLSEGLKGYNCPGDWVDALKERDIEKEKANRYIHEFMYIDLIHYNYSPFHGMPGLP